MPTILLVNGFRFFFYSRENNEPAHVHVAKGEAEGKIWLEPVIEIVTTHHQQFKNRWNEYFNK